MDPFDRHGALRFIRALARVLKYHHVVSYGRNWRFDRALPVGTVVRKRFRHPGTYRFRRTYHSTLIGTTCTGMCGSVVVRS